jgi:hypothetical protein
MNATHYKFSLLQAMLASALTLMPFPGAVAWAGEQPKLVLQITVDALRGDLPGRFSNELGDGGFSLSKCHSGQSRRKALLHIEGLHNNLKLLRCGQIREINRLLYPFIFLRMPHKPCPSRKYVLPDILDLFQG